MCSLSSVLSLLKDSLTVEIMFCVTHGVNISDKFCEGGLLNLKLL